MEPLIGSFSSTAIPANDHRNRNNQLRLPNQFLLPPLTIAQLYRCCWQVELFFKWIKHLRIKAFCVTSENAVKD